jgi:hypothetical protein
MILTLLAVLAAVSPGCDATVVLFEARTTGASIHCIDFTKWSVSKSESSGSGLASPSIDRYLVKDHHLRYRDKTIAEAVEILAQTSVGEHDLVVVRYEYNSFSNPLRLLSAVAGHPVQVSEIIALAVSDGRVVKRWRLARVASSYEWRADVRTAG